MDRMFIIPHSHFDAEIFKTRDEYLEWGYRTIITALKLLKADRAYRFTLEQVCLVKPFLERYPELEEIFKAYVREGRLGIVCGMYAMADVNMPSGESLVRQFLAGKNYFREKLGVDVKTSWTIDSFGHHSQMVQILKKSGFEYMVFGRATNLELSEFIWKGIDGSSIICHYMPFHYGIFHGPHGCPAHLQGFKQFVNDRYERLRPFSVSGNILAMEGADHTPPVEHTADMVRLYNDEKDKLVELKIAVPEDFFNELLKYKEKLPVVSEDFNPIFQGCYSARIELKQRNRQLENHIRSAELFDALAWNFASKRNEERFDDIWEPVLFNQFHDDLCGCHVDKVFDLNMKRYDESSCMTDRILEGDLKAVAEQIDTTGSGIPVIVFNQLGWARKDAVEVPIAFASDDVYSVKVTDSTGRKVDVQLEEVARYKGGGIRQAKVVFVAEVPSFGYEVYRILKEDSETGIDFSDEFYDTTFEIYNMRQLDNAMLENKYYKIKFDLWTGLIGSLILKDTGDELVNVEMPYCNMLVREMDNGDFWEVNTPLRGCSSVPYKRSMPLSMLNAPEYSKDMGGKAEVKIGHVKSSFIYTQKISSWVYKSNVTLYEDVERIVVNSTIINFDKNVRYRIAFPMNIKNGKIVHEIPFGSIERPEGEYAAQNWIDYSNDGKGIGLLNCGLPGNAVMEDTLLLSLLKCTAYVSYEGDSGGYDPTVSADGGYELGKEHKFRYGLVPHTGNWKDARMYWQGEELNNPLIARKAPARPGKLPARMSFIDISTPNVVATCVKRTGGALIIRMYEAEGAETTSVKIRFGMVVKSFCETNLMEEEVSAGQKLQTGEDSIEFSMGAFEIKTFKVEI